MKCPLTGLECNKPKIIPIIEITESGTNTLDLCEECAHMHLLNQEAEKEIDKIKQEDIHTSANDILKSLVEIGLEFMQQLEENSPPPIEDCCSFCGATNSDINRTGRLGCMHCYEHFGSDIISSIQSYHGSNKHVGKVPPHWKSKEEENKRIEIRKNFTIETYIRQIEEIIKAAIKKEQYETAAIGRDKLKEILRLQEKHRNLEKKISETNDESLVSEIKDQIKQIVDQCFTDWLQSTS